MAPDDERLKIRSHNYVRCGCEFCMEMVETIEELRAARALLDDFYEYAQKLYAGQKPTNGAELGARYADIRSVG